MNESVHLKDVEREFLLEGTRTGKLGYVAADGRPLIAPIWFVLDGNDLVFNTDANSAKAKAMQRDPRVCLCVDQPEAPYGFVQVQGTVTWTDDLEAMLPWATQIGGRYMGEDRAAEFGRRNAVEGEWLVRITPVKVISAFNVSD